MYMYIWDLCSILQWEGKYGKKRKGLGRGGGLLNYTREHLDFYCDVWNGKEEIGEKGHERKKEKWSETKDGSGEISVWVWFGFFLL